MQNKTKLVDIFVSKKLQFNNEKYSQGEWEKLGWHDLFDVSNLIQGSFSSQNNNTIKITNLSTWNLNIKYKNTFKNTLNKT